MKNRETQKRFGREETHGECAVNGSHEPGVTVNKWKPGGSLISVNSRNRSRERIIQRVFGGN